MLFLAAEAERHANQGISYAVGATALVILLTLIGTLLAFGRGREHS